MIRTNKSYTYCLEKYYKALSMHTIATKVSARERELAPRYYYKLAEKTSCLERMKSFIRSLLTFMFTQVGVIVLIASYMLCGAALFTNIEADSQLQQAVEAKHVRSVNCLIL